MISLKKISVPHRLLMIAFIFAFLSVSNASVPRLVNIEGRDFKLASSNEPIVLGGPNIVVKGPPYMPYVTGTTMCNADVVND